MGSSDLFFRKHKQDSAFRVSGILQLSKTGLKVTKNFPLLRSFISTVMMARRFYTPCDVNCTNLHILTAREMRHIFDSNWPTLKQEKKFVSAFPKNKLENSESEDHRLQFFRKEGKISFHRHFKTSSNIQRRGHISALAGFHGSSSLVELEFGDVGSC